MKRIFKGTIFLIFLLTLSGCNQSKTVEEAIKKDPDWNSEIVSTVYITDETAVVYMEESLGKVEAGSVIKANNGWQTLEKTPLLWATNATSGLSGMSASLKINEEEFIVLTWGTIVDDSIDRVVVEANNQERTASILTSNNGTRIYFVMDEATEQQSLNYRLIAFSKEGDVLYENPVE